MKKNLIILFIILALFANISVYNTYAADGEGYLIKSNPSGAVVYLNGNYVGVTPYKLLNVTVNSSIKIAKGGYAEVTKKLTSTSGEETIELVKLSKRSILFVTSNPVQISYLIKETSQTGATPVVVDNLEAGNYTIIFSKDGFKDLTKKVSLNGGLTFVKIDLEAGTSSGDEPTNPDEPDIPTKTYTSIKVDTNINACEIYLDGKYKGLSPISLTNLVVGTTHKISAYKNGYDSNYTNYKVEKDGTVSLELIKTTIRYTSLTIKSNVSSTTMYINGAKYVGSSITVSSLKVGTKVTVKLVKSGYADQTKTITLTSSGNSLSFIMKKVVSVIVDTVPGNAILMISKNGMLTKMGTTPMRLEGLTVGTQYILVLQKDGYKSVNFKYTAKENDDPITFNLEPLA